MLSLIDWQYVQSFGINCEFHEKQPSSAFFAVETWNIDAAVDTASRYGSFIIKADAR